MDQIERLVLRQLPLLRSQLAVDVSDREAYVDLVVLNAYGGTGQTEIWIDDLEVACQASTGISTDRLPGEATSDATVAAMEKEATSERASASPRSQSDRFRWRTPATGARDRLQR